MPRKKAALHGYLGPVPAGLAIVPLERTSFEFEPKLDPDAVVNSQVRTHASEIDWQLAPVVADLYAWFDRFNERFFSASLPKPALGVARLRKGTLGTYLVGRDELGLASRITISHLLSAAPASKGLAVLLHESVHAWETALNDRQGGSWYHSKKFRAKAEALGIPTSKRGEFLGITPDSPFARLLSEHGVALDSSSSRDILPGPETQARVSSIKWACACTVAYVAAGQSPALTCRNCKQLLRRSAPRRSSGSRG